MIKKQTVWLLTMLSLMIVLSVYYISTDKNDFSTIDNMTTTNEVNRSVDENDEAKVELEEMENVGYDEYFAMLRLELQDNRSVKIDRLKDIIASSSATTDEKNEALNSIDAIDVAKSKEYILEETIHTIGEYEDVLVRSEDDKVHVHIKSAELSKEEVVQIMQLVRDEFGDLTVDVNLQTS